MAASSRYRLTRAQRLGRRAEFQQVKAQGKPSYSPYFTVIVRPSPFESLSRLGIITSRHYGIATQRTSIRRYIREVFRLSQHDFHLPYDVVVIPKPNAQKLNYAKVKQELLKLWQKLHVLEN